MPYYNFISYIDTYWQWITVEIHTVSNQSPKILSCQRLSDIAIFIPSYSRTNII